MLGDLHILSRENHGFENWWHVIIASDCAGWERSIQVQRFDLFLSHTWLTNGRTGGGPVLGLANMSMLGRGTVCYNAVRPKRM